MARTSRKQHKGLSGGMGKPRKGTGLQTAMEKVFQTALYVRLSVLDSGKKDSDTVETQEALLRQFLEGKPCFSIFDVYVDNGETGVDFKRDGFERLMEDVRAGRIDCIVVKDDCVIIERKHRKPQKMRVLWCPFCFLTQNRG